MRSNWSKHEEKKKEKYDRLYFFYLVPSASKRRDLIVFHHHLGAISQIVQTRLKKREDTKSNSLLPTSYKMNTLR